MSVSLKDWWRGAVIYQIYPRSFMDSNRDGIGDLKGITKKLDYVASLGVDAIWISPFFKSPMKDFGYDVSDYCDVDPMFGTLDDFRALLDKAHGMGIKVIIDLVLSHTSDEHGWFRESRSNRTNAKADWYVWADPKPDGSPPNNWMSVFGGPSWTYDVRRGQYYLHNFLSSQPDINLHNPEARQAVLDACRFWLDMGVDGFRLDAATHYFHNPSLADNPPNPTPRPSRFNISFPTPFTMQQHVNDVQVPEALVFVEEIRTLLDEYDGRMAVAEIGGERGIELAAMYTDGPKRLHTAYNFSLISGDKPSASFIAKAIETFERQPGDKWPSWAFSNHDVTRIVSRWGQDEDHDPRLAKTLLAVLLSLRGSLFLYQGEELGLPDVTIPYDKIQDPWGKFLYPEWQGRDGCRTPMPWTDTPHKAGFTAAKEGWLPIPHDHLPLSVKKQQADKDSTLNFSRAYIKWRKQQPAMITGKCTFIEQKEDQVLSLIRHLPDSRVLCIFNMAATPMQASMPSGVDLSKAVPFSAGKQTGTISRDGKSIILPPFGIYCTAIK